MENIKENNKLIAAHVANTCVTEDPYLLKEYWHVIKTDNKLEVKPSKYHLCTKVKDSIACFTKREFAIDHLNNQELK